MYRLGKKILGGSTSFQKAQFIGLGLVVLLGVSWAVYVYLKVANGQSVGEVRPAEVAPEVKGVPKISIVPEKPILVYGGGAKTKKKAGLSKAVVLDEDISIIAASRVASDDNPHEIITTINKRTGESSTVDIKKPLPWVAFDTRGSVGIYGGFSDLGETARIQAKQNIICIKNLCAGAIASIDQPISSAAGGVLGGPRYFVGFGGELRWQ